MNIHNASCYTVIAYALVDINSRSLTGSVNWENHLSRKLTSQKEARYSTNTGDSFCTVNVKETATITNSICWRHFVIFCYRIDNMLVHWYTVSELSVWENQSTKSDSRIFNVYYG